MASTIMNGLVSIVLFVGWYLYTQQQAAIESLERDTRQALIFDGKVEGRLDRIERDLESVENQVANLRTR